jgi:hypothetical protein
MINENIISLVNEQYNDALRMTKEMNHVCKSADNAMCTMNTLRREFEECRNLVKELALKRAKNNLKLAEMKTLLAKFLEGSVEDRIHALAEEYNSTSGPKYSLLHASTYVDIENELAAIKKEIDKYETAVNNKAMLIGGCHFAIRDLYVKFQNALVEAKQQKEAVAKKQAEAKPKTITIMVDTSWPLSPREIQHAIDVLKAFKPVGEDGLGMKSAAEALELFKKSVENHIEKHTKVVEDGLYFKLSEAE